MKEKSFPSTEQDQTTVKLILNVSMKNEHARQYLVPYLKEILSAVVKEMQEKSVSDHHEFMIQFMVNMIRLDCEVEIISRLVSALPMTEKDNFNLHLFLRTSLAMAEQSDILVVLPAILSSESAGVGLPACRVNRLVEMSVQFVR